MTETEGIMAAMDAAALYVSSMTGIKKMYMDQGWSEERAEWMVVVMAKDVNER